MLASYEMRRDVYWQLVRVLSLPTCAWPHYELVAARFRQVKRQQYAVTRCPGVIREVRCMQGPHRDCHQYLHATGAATCEENKPHSQKCCLTICQQVRYALHNCFQR